MQDGHQLEEESIDILELVDSLEELVGVSRRMPFSGRILVDEEAFLSLVDQLRVTVPREIREAQRVIHDRERIILEAQEEATKILKTARDRAEYMVSSEGILNEARQQGEELLRQAEERRKRHMGELELFALDRFTIIEEAMRQGMGTIEEAMRETVGIMEEAKERALSRNPQRPSSD
jgi:uncharacterized protein YjcR